ncbi:MAG: GMC family oxidoreductase N-terminal domain-containing protein [Epibacterium sp.]|nr:GMC family oxidoreductase N-terminal domain-containing protein [Epibacterium sp.]NQX72671.1 GMC family oxidoreductase N-terminal domain-containing protein [Epibacterium sp.]
MQNQFDYIVVGGGSAGCVLAARLSENPDTRVCLIEAGGHGNGMLVRMPIGIAATVPGQIAPGINYAYKTGPQPGLNGRQGFQPRGRALGGSSAINAMVYMRGHQKDYDAWAEMGCTGWSYDDVLPYFIKSEYNQRGASKFHGGDGPLQVADQYEPRPISRAFLAAAEACGVPTVDDLTTPNTHGAALNQVHQFHDERRGERCSVAAAYLFPVQSRPNLHVMTKSLVQRVLIKDGRAYGVKVRHRSKSTTLTARNEVILSGGAFNSPQLLMLSGIGPAEHLKEHGIVPMVDAPEVGQNLQDHPDYVSAYKTTTTDVFGVGVMGAVHLIKGLMRWRRDGTGIPSSPLAEVSAFFGSSPEFDDWPDIQLQFVVAMLVDHGRRILPGYGVSCHGCLLRPKSRGSVTLATGNASDAPLIDPQFLSEDEDLERLTQGVKKMHEIMSAAPMAAHIKSQLFLTGGENDDALKASIRARTDSVYHPVGTCRMGSDEASVVDTDLKVRGVAGLRVVDASVMPVIISGNTNAATVMIAEKAAETIVQSARIAQPT